MRLFSEETIKGAENVIKTVTDYDGLTKDSERINVLLKYCELLFILNHFERIYNLIFGSQLRILQKLNSVVGEQKESLHKYYQYVSARNKDFFDNYSYDSYLDFMKKENLIIENNEGLIQITRTGIDFLIFLTDFGKPFDKPY